MGHLNVYINKANADKLATEQNKSGLINSLLDQYYSKSNSIKSIDLSKQINAPKIIKNTEQVLPAVKQIKSVKDNPIKLCKIHGIPLDHNGKCLQKDCKYS